LDDKIRSALREHLAWWGLTRFTTDRQLHIELGRSEGLVYLYCANTFDQRQLVIVERARAAMLDSYYREIIGGVA
jgi:hypothetical protein